MNIPLFPLHTVLFPGGVLPLRIFEPRYLDMVSECLRAESPFGVCLIREGRETGTAAAIHEIGTLVRISWFEQRADGLLGISVDGQRRFRVCAQTVQPDQLLRGRVELLAEEKSSPLPQRYAALAELLQTLFEQLGSPYTRLRAQYADAVWVGARLCELLPLDLAIKQRLLQLDDPLERLERLQAAISAGDFV